MFGAPRVFQAVAKDKLYPGDYDNFEIKNQNRMAN
jgi:hypothetical protein